MPGSSSSSSSSAEEKKQIKARIATIGLGTGLTAVWAADASPEVEVWAFEKESEVGGNVQSPILADQPREAGAEFIGPRGDESDPEIPERSYRDTHRVFDILGVKRVPFPLTMSFYNEVTGEHLTLPPLEPYYDKEAASSSSCGFFSCFGLGKSSTTTGKHLSLSTLWDHFFDLIDLKTIIDEAYDLELSEEDKHVPRDAILLAKHKALKPSEVMTLEQLAEHFINKVQIKRVQEQRRAFVENILYPLIAAGWGLHQVSKIKNFCAHYAMHYLEVKGNWYDIPEGIHSYFEKMLAQLSSRTKVQTNSPIEHVIPIEIDGKTKYHLQRSDGSLVTDDTDQPVVFDDVIIATPAYATGELLSKIEDDEFQTLIGMLYEVKFFDTTIVHHQDPKFVFKDGTVANTHYNPETDQASNTMVKAFKNDKEDVKKSWILPGQEMPANVLHVAKFRHATMDRSYYECEQAMHHLQGKKGLYFGGTMGGRGDAHESGIRNNLTLITKCLASHGINPAENPILQHFPEILESVLGAAPIKVKHKATTAQPSYQSFRLLSPILIDADNDSNTEEEEERKQASYAASSTAT
ncbi:hypothetical protein BN59_01247 [Legionella massiliensis]|uniref:Protoporphyrinogen oxidase n=1 Tax=Legionella massiliensis TaxID=1034943 RepID=A0A078KZ35_9GAMM|nr:hypothetical protein [Legionella massiliensis]CDZ76968.1 hypothetical protein BN59_01247 [Legionella massiliensis]CEE12706.1 hypothetical protein BN1094_01247 [Legionella massiliensis]